MSAIIRCPLCSMSAVDRFDYKTISHIFFETLIPKENLKRLHSGFFELKMLEMFTRAFLLKIFIGAWSCLLWLFQVLIKCSPKKWKKNHQKDTSHLNKWICNGVVDVVLWPKILGSGRGILMLILIAMDYFFRFQKSTSI